MPYAIFGYKTVEPTDVDELFSAGPFSTRCSAEKVLPEAVKAHPYLSCWRIEPEYQIPPLDAEPENVESEDLNDGRPHFPVELEPVE